MTTDPTSPFPALLPIWAVRCLRCEEWIDVRCACPPLPSAIIGIGTGTTGHRASCRPTYRETGGALPDRCPRCKAVAWLDAPRYRRGQGVSIATRYRRAAAEKRAGRKKPAA